MSPKPVQTIGTDKKIPEIPSDASAREESEDENSGMKFGACAQQMGRQYKVLEIVEYNDENENSRHMMNAAQFGDRQDDDSSRQSAHRGNKPHGITDPFCGDYMCGLSWK